MILLAERRTAVRLDGLALQDVDLMAERRPFVSRLPGGGIQLAYEVGNELELIGTHQAIATQLGEQLRGLAY